MWLQSVQRQRILMNSRPRGVPGLLGGGCMDANPRPVGAPRPPDGRPHRCRRHGGCVSGAPRNALLILAGLVPLGSTVGLMVGGPCSLTEPLAMAFLSGWLSKEAFGSKPPLSAGTRRLIVPVVLLATVVAASSVVGMAAIQPFVAFPLRFLREVLSFFWSESFFDQNRFEPFTAGLRFLEGLGLFAAARNPHRTDERPGATLARVSVAAALASLRCP